MVISSVSAQEHSPNSTQLNSEKLGKQSTDAADQHGQQQGQCNHFKERVIVLIYQLQGLRTEEDGHVLEEVLKKKGIALESEVHFNTSNIYVTVNDENLTNIIKDILVSAGEQLGYPIGVDLFRKVYRDAEPGSDRH